MAAAKKAAAAQALEEKDLALGRFKNSLSIGILGLPNVGKSTLFNLLTKSQALAANYPFATKEPNIDTSLDSHVKARNDPLLLFMSKTLTVPLFDGLAALYLVPPCLMSALNGFSSNTNPLSVLLPSLRCVLPF